jgi:hypothetical protein
MLVWSGPVISGCYRDLYTLFGCSTALSRRRGSPRCSRYAASRLHELLPWNWKLGQISPLPAMITPGLTKLSTDDFVTAQGGALRSSVFRATIFERGFDPRETSAMLPQMLPPTF